MGSPLPPGARPAPRPREAGVPVSAVGVALLVLMWVGADAVIRESFPLLPEEIVGTAARHDFPYRRMLWLADKGDETAMTALLEFSRHTDAGGAFCHAVILADVEATVGLAAMARALARVRDADRPGAQALLEAGRAERGHPAGTSPAGDSVIDPFPPRG